MASPNRSLHYCWCPPYIQLILCRHLEADLQHSTCRLFLRMMSADANPFLIQLLAMKGGLCMFHCFTVCFAGCSPPWPSISKNIGVGTVVIYFHGSNSSSLQQCSLGKQMIPLGSVTENDDRNLEVEIMPEETSEDTNFAEVANTSNQGKPGAHLLFYKFSVYHTYM